MLNEIHLENFRCYERHTVRFKNNTIVIGKNNAGKSTLIESIRLISLVLNRYKTGRFIYAPRWTQFPVRYKGISPSLDRIDFSLDNIIHLDEDPPATIIAKFDSKAVVHIRLSSEDGIFATIFNNDGSMITNQSDAKNCDIPPLNILPQIGPLLKKEKALEKSYVKSSIYSSLASRHFRNQLSYFHENYNKFKSLSESTWTDLRLINLRKASKGLDEVDPYFVVQEGLFATEVGDMGHGLQMWLQTMWFLARIDPKGTVVLDEPDVYMHADLQRKLIRIVNEIFDQVIVATHSLEIMAEVEPDNILIIDRNKDISIFATDMPAVQQVISSDIGSVHNLGLARLWSANKLLWVEGNDIGILKRFQSAIFPKSKMPLDIVPSSDMGGWGGWKYAIGSSIMMRNAGDERIRVYCLFDSDYHLPPEIEQRYAEAEEKDIWLHIWKMKEIENYLINSEVISRVVNREKKDSMKSLTVKELDEQIIRICESMKREVEDDYSSEIMKHYRGKGHLADFTNDNVGMKYETKYANRIARNYVDQRWGNPREIVGGKRLIKELNKWLVLNFKVNINPLKLSSSFYPHEVHPEIKMVLSSIEKLEQFKNQHR